MASPSFYEKNTERFGTIMIKIVKPKRIWIGKARMCLSSFQALETGVDVICTDNLDLITENEKVSKYIFAQYYDPI